ncbi:MAG: hypothetical protein HGA44_07290, partial [Cellulomonadaceae bacterium]|nr:hypothetical protein [Cellulomonadaceae bacterium]
PLDLLITADLALLPLGPLHAAAAARTSPWCAPAAPPAPPPADAEEPGARGTLLAPAPADTAARPAPDAPVVEVLTARAGPGGDGVVAELVTEALAAGRRVAVIAPVDEDLVPFATRLAAGGLTPFALDLTGPCATRDGLRAHLSASGRPTAPPVVAAAGVARERSDLLAQLAADTALADVLGPAGLSLWQAWTEASRLEAELPPEAVVAAREIDLPSDVARSPAARSTLLGAATQVGEAMGVTIEQDRWPADGLDRWSPEVARAVSSATQLLLAAEAALTGPLRTLAGSAATVTELTALARWLRATALTAPVPLGDAVERCDAVWSERARTLRLDLEQLDRMHREDLAGLRPSVLDLDPAPLLAELDAEPERGWLGRVTGRSPETRQEAKVARRLAAHRAPLRRTAQGDLRGQLAALERARALADDVRTLATTLLDAPAPWNPLAEDDRDLVLQLVETWEATAGIAHVPGVAADVLDAVVPAAGATRREPGRRAGQDPAGAVIALADGATALASALGVDADDEEWLAGRAVLATLDQERAGWSADLADGLPALRRRVLLRTGLAALRAVGAPDLVAVVGAAEQDGAPDHPRRGLPPVRPEHLAGVAELAVLHRVLDERRRAAEAAPARLSTAARAVLVDRAADLERAHRGAARDVIPHRLLGHVPGGPEGRAELADQLTAGLEHSPLRPFLAEHGDGVGALLPVQLVPTELLPWSLPVLPNGGLLVVDRADQVPAASIAAAAARAGHVVLVDRTEGQPHDVGSALGALGPGAPAAGDARDRRPEVRALPTEPSWERHRAVVTAASLIAGLTVSEPGGPDGRVADLAVALAGGPAVALLLAQPGPASQSAAGTGRATPLPDGASPPEVALTAWLARGGARSPDAGGAWTAVRSISLTAWVVDRGEVIDEVVRAARGHGSGQAGPVRLG